jgi:hypothetical protein
MTTMPCLHMQPLHVHSLDDVMLAPSARRIAWVFLAAAGRINELQQLRVVALAPPGAPERDSRRHQHSLASSMTYMYLPLQGV